MKYDKPMVIAIVGPTASGKSDVGVRLAKKINGAIISGDSMQVYKRMDIGTAKPSEDELNEVEHHLIDVLEPTEEFNVSKYQALAHDAIMDITSRGKVPIVVGGTGLYIDALLKGFIFPDTGKSEEVREALMQEGEEKGSILLHERLTSVDSEAASKIHPNDLRRIIRALEVYMTSGKPISEMQRMHDSTKLYSYQYFGLDVERESIRNKIDIRVDKMIEAGLIEEVKSLIDSGFAECIISMQAIGYKELVRYFFGESTLDEAITHIKTETKKYAKRQMTWFKRSPDTMWMDANEPFDGERIATEIVGLLNI